ncbi:MAG: tyrosinase [Solirubrobacteraceae bacterium]|jgi:tyrosinase|nr:tyrosinase [Solirubrobacteraceae bacterium]
MLVDTVGRVWYPWLTPQSESIVVAQIVLVPAPMRLTGGDLVTPDGSSPRVRRSLTELQDEHAKGNTKPLDDLMRAWQGIKALEPDNPKSFFALGGLHGEPFRGAGWGSNQYWGGYCNHGNVLFPTWHRMYVLKLEEALQSIDGCHHVMMAFWDETADHGDDPEQTVIPWALTDAMYDFGKGEIVPNPLRSFVFNRKITDFIGNDVVNYSKPKNYETVRYPLSGLVGTEADRDKTTAHNAKYPDYEENVKILDANVRAWLDSEIVVKKKPIPTGVRQKYEDCLDAPNYTLFSNTSSAAQWNNDHDPKPPIVPIESPHNSIHLAIGGYDGPGFDRSPISGANGDMGENDTAGLDPIFFFHHCFIDRVFWLWQTKHGFTDHVEVMDGYVGTNSVDGQGATPGVPPNSWLTLDSPLNPWKRNDGTPHTSRDCLNIEAQLGYTYGPGSLDELVKPRLMAAAAEQGGSQKTIRVTGLDRAAIRGSFLIAAYATVGGERHQVGSEAVLSRWSVAGCANCQSHLQARAFMGLTAFPEETLADAKFTVEVRTRDEVLVSDEVAPGDAHPAGEGKVRRLRASGGPSAPKAFRVEIR